MKRQDDYELRRGHLKSLSDDALKDRFWELAKQLTDPMLQMGRQYTSPAIERSVLLRMGFSSLEAKAIVDACMEKGLLCHGAGHVVYKLSGNMNVSLRQAGEYLARGEQWETAAGLFTEVEDYE